MTTPLIEAIARALCWSEGEPANCAHFYTESAKAVLSALTEAGYILAPKEPTEAMEEAARDVPFIAMGNGEYLEPDRADIYRAMINAATHCNNNGKAE